MAYKKRELSSEDLQAFDALIGYLQASGQGSINLRDFLAGGNNDAERAYQAAREAAQRAKDLQRRVDEATAILEKVFERIDPDSVTLGQLNREVSLQKLIEIRRGLKAVASN